MLGLEIGYRRTYARKLANAVKRRFDVVFGGLVYQHATTIQCTHMHIQPYNPAGRAHTILLMDVGAEGGGAGIVSKSDCLGLELMSATP